MSIDYFYVGQKVYQLIFFNLNNLYAVKISYESNLAVFVAKLVTGFFLSKYFALTVFLISCFLQDPLPLERCIVCCEPEWEDFFEIQDFVNKESFIFKASPP